MAVLHVHVTREPLSFSSFYVTFHEVPFLLCIFFLITGLLAEVVGSWRFHVKSEMISD